MATIDWTTEVLDQLDTHWHERLRPRLDGLTDDELLWEPVPGCWSVRPRGEGTVGLAWGSGDFALDIGPEQVPAPVTTIAWRLGHLAECFASTTATWFGGPLVDAGTYPYPGTATTVLERLDHEQAAFVAGVRALGDAGLAEPQGDRSPAAYAHAPIARVVLYTSVEVVHHGAEACLLRDLWARRDDLRR